MIVVAIVEVVVVVILADEVKLKQNQNQVDKMIKRRQQEQAQQQMQQQQIQQQQQVSKLHQKSGATPHVKRMHSIQSPNDDPEMSHADNMSHDDMKGEQFVTLGGPTPPAIGAYNINTMNNLNALPSTQMKRWLILLEENIHQIYMIVVKMIIQV